jgi:magnesium-transporting ATPase (P-type)
LEVEGSGEHNRPRYADVLQAYILPVLYSQPDVLFSAQTIYEQWLLTFWNVFFTSLPVLAFGIFEKVRLRS